MRGFEYLSHAAFTKKLFHKILAGDDFADYLFTIRIRSRVGHFARNRVRQGLRPLQAAALWTQKIWIPGCVRRSR